MDSDLEHDDLLADEDPEPSAPDPAQALAAVATCLRHLACGYGLDPREREACLRLLQGPQPRACPADIEAAQKVIRRATQRLSARSRDRASALAVRLAELTAGGKRTA